MTEEFEELYRKKKKLEEELKKTDKLLSQLENNDCNDWWCPSMCYNFQKECEVCSLDCDLPKMLWRDLIKEIKNKVDKIESIKR